MAKVEYAPQGVCARLMKFEVEDGKLHNLRVLGGCNGNLQGIGKLTEGMELQFDAAFWLFIADNQAA